MGEPLGGETLGEVCGSLGCTLEAVTVERTERETTGDVRREESPSSWRSAEASHQQKARILVQGLESWLSS